MRRTSQDGLDLIKHAEGLMLGAYLDAVGIPTIGYGSIRGVQLGDKITPDEAEARLKDDLASAESCVNRHCPNVTQHQFDALVSFTFNEGCGALSNSTLLRLVRIGDCLGAAEEFQHWTRAGNTHLAGLVARRAAERTLFLTPDEVAMPEGWLRADHAPRIRTASESQHAVPAAGQAA